MTVYKNRADYTPPPCPHCGGPSRPTWVNILANFHEVGSVVVQLECANRCLQAKAYEAEMKAFYDSIRVPIVPIKADS